MSTSPAPGSGTQTTARLAIVGTAGHIDHGKTALVRRLTGVDTDRLPEEKRRGISIDLGFARLVTPGGAEIGIVDVPGHERFVKNMLAGVGGIDLVLLVIAADEGVMPQTREHLAIVKLLGVARGVVVLTKSDLVDRDWMELVRRDVKALLADTPLAAAPIVEFSAITGQGQEELLAAIDVQLVALAAREPDAPARLPVDRVFVVEGFGTVVTGTLWRGHVRTGDTLTVLPQDKAVRVRRVQVHGRTVDEARAGQRTAIALHGVSKDEVARGDWLVAPDSLKPSSILDVRFELLADVPRDWPVLSRVRFHLGASELLGRLVLLEGKPLAPGCSALAQIRLESPTVAARGDRFVLRQRSPMRTIGGGTVIEPVATKRRRQAAGLDALAVHEAGSLSSRLLQRLAGEKKPIATAAIAQALSENEPAVLTTLAALAAKGEVVASAGHWMSADRLRAAREAIVATVTKHSAEFPARFGIAKGDLKSGFKKTLDADLFDVAFESLIEDGRLEQRAERVREAGTPWEPPAETLAALERVETKLESTGLAVPEMKEWSAQLGARAGEVLGLGYFLGRLERVTQELTYTKKQLETLRASLAAHFAKQSTLSVADFKSLTGGLSRKYAVPLLEHSDRVGWTIRVGDERKAGGRL